MGNFAVSKTKKALPKQSLYDFLKPQFVTLDIISVLKECHSDLVASG